MNFPISLGMSQSSGINQYLKQLGTQSSVALDSTNPMSGLLNASPEDQAKLLQALTAKSQTVDDAQKPDIKQIVVFLLMLLMQLLGKQDATAGEAANTEGNNIQPLAQQQPAQQPVAASMSSRVSNQGSGQEHTHGANHAGNNKGLTNLSSGNDGAVLNDSLGKIANDPEGAKLIAAAQEKGITIEVGDPAAASGSNDESVKGVTLTDGNGNTKIIVRDPSNIKTIAHELVHAVSTGDDDSKEEEGIADVIGSRIANRQGGAEAGGLSGSDQQIFLNKQKFYPGLDQSNDIRNTLASLGLPVNV